jgi:hypothetical protein
VAQPTLAEEGPKCCKVFGESIAARRGNHRARRGGWKLTAMGGRFRGRSSVGAVVVDGSRWAPVVSVELRWVLQHEGRMGSEEGLMAEEDDGQRWELTVRGMKRRWQL